MGLLNQLGPESDLVTKEISEYICKRCSKHVAIVRHNYYWTCTQIWLDEVAAPSCDLNHHPGRTLLEKEGEESIL